MLGFLRRRAQRPPIDFRIWLACSRLAPPLAALSAERALRLRELAAGFLVRKAITPVAGLELDDTERALVACLCCLPVLELGGAWLGGWHEVVVYPRAFNVRRQSVDEPTGVVHEWDDELAGESWSHGPLILSWEDIQIDMADPGAGYNLVAHEIAHKLDQRDGALNGTPPLPPGRLGPWVRDFQAAYDALNESLDAGAEPIIDAYAAEAPEEFFAVTSEYHFSAPALLAEAMPAVAAHLRAFYGPSPFSPPG